MDPAGQETSPSRAGKGNHVAVLGAALSANKGAASMLLALVDHIDEVLPGGVVKNLSTYPGADRLVNRSERLEIISYTPLAMLLVNFPLALVIGLSRLLFGMRGRVFARTTALRVLMDTRVVADLAGISFSDGRGIPTLAYNTLMTGIPLLVGVPVVKCSQAIGPLDALTTKLAARLILPRLSAVVARGQGTHQHLIRFGLANVEEGADLAFAMTISEQDESLATELVADTAAAGYFVVSPSSVVKELCEEQEIDYVELMADLVEKCSKETGLSAVLIAHSARPGQGPSRMNDLPVTREVAEHCTNDLGVVHLDRDLDPRVLRAVIGGGRLLIASRFHAMISGLATRTPTVVVGWSHKYHEVLAEFGLEDFVIPFSRFSSDQVLDLAVRAHRDHDQISARVAERLPSIEESSRASLRALRRAIDG